MISVRTLTITGIFVVLFCTGLFFYTEYDIRKFNESLPTPPTTRIAVETDDKTSAPIGETTPNSHLSRAESSAVEMEETDPSTSDFQQRSTTPEMTQSGAEDASDISQTEIDTVFDDAFAFFDDSSLFGNLNLAATRAELEKLLRELHGEDPRVSAFLDDWDTTSRILSLRTEYNESGADDEAMREQIFAMNPTEVLPKTFELGIELIQPSDAVTTQRSEWLHEWVEFTEKMEIVHYAGILAEDAFKDGSITADDAEAFVEEASGLDVEVVEVTDK